MSYYEISVYMDTWINLGLSRADIEWRSQKNWYKHRCVYSVYVRAIVNQCV